MIEFNIHRDCNCILRSQVFRGIGYCLLAAIAFYILFQGFYNKIAYNDVWPYENAWELWYSFANNFSAISVLFVFNSFIVYKAFRGITVKWKISFDAILSLAVLIITNLIWQAFIVAKVNWAGSIFCNTFIFMGCEMSWYVQNFRLQTKKTYAAEKQVLKYKYDTLKSQVNPHFLFNSLNILYSLIPMSQKKSQEFVVSLSEIYRYIIDGQSREQVRVEEELRFLESYVMVLRIRYGDGFNADISCDPNCGQRQIIPYTLQLLVENVIKHNTISARNPMKVSVKIHSCGIEVSNRIAIRKLSSGSGVGLKYLREMYALYGKVLEAGVYGAFFIVRIPYL